MSMPENLPSGLDSSKSKGLRKLPDTAVCRVNHWVGDLYDCLVEGPCGCPHVLSYGDAYFCRHPNRTTMAASRLAA